LDKHRLWLTPAAIHHWLRPEVPVNGVPFVVTVDREPIYSRALFPSYSSLSYHRVAIDLLIAEDG
jgi:hypothetical protein